ncbi:MAG: HAMP domain-containing histidine kinase [Treponema sp.]|nr:HAMP domain-containing histidine kinase [Treponema sp.]
MSVSFFHSASTKLSLRFMLLLSAAVLSLSLVFTGLLRSFVRQEQSADLIKAAEEIRANMEKGSDGFFMPYYITYAVWEWGTLDAVHTNDPFLPHLPLTDGSAKLYLQKDFFIDGDLNILYYASDCILSDGKGYQIETAMNMDSDTSSLLLKGVPSTLARIVIPVLILSFLVSLIITRNTMRPVVRMTERARRIGSENLGETLPVRHKAQAMDENDALAATFNDLFARLKADFDREKAFTSDVSHELRTPVAVILGQAKLLLRWGKDDRAQTEKSLSMIIKETHSMESTIENLLQMSRLESGRQLPKSEQFSVADLLSQIAEETRSLAEEASVSVDCPPELVLRSDRELLHQALTVVTSNSVKFCRAAGREPAITLGAAEEGERLVIRAGDNGPGFSPEVLPHVFERFYRGDGAHNRKAGGSGLGLSIAQVIVTVLGGRISAGNREDGGGIQGAVMTMELPL